MDKRRFEERLKELNQKAIQIGKSFKKPQYEWVWVGHDGAKLKWSCPLCGRGVEDQENFCPDCGRRMKKETDNEVV